MTREPVDSHPAEATLRVKVARHLDGTFTRTEDLVTVEEPLEIRVVAESAGRRRSRSVAVTMRTPGEDFDLATGFLFSEGVVDRPEDIWRIEHCDRVEGQAFGNVIDVHLAPAKQFDADRLSRHVLISSACGICGRTSIDAVRQACAARPVGDFQISSGTLLSLTEVLSSRQAVFARTGGLHAAALFDSEGRMLDLREDVGRHNAVDKLVGGQFLQARLPSSQRLVLVSGRVSFELVQKSILAGIPMLAAVGAPSSLAIDLASEFGMTLIGFLGQNRFNIYSGRERVTDA
jgi:FdhD protein